MTLRRRAAALVAGLALGAAVLAGCGSEGARTNCSIDACTVTFDRGSAASASVLGVEAKLVSAENDRVTVEVAGQRLALAVGQPATEVAGLQVSLTSVTDEDVVVRIARDASN